MTLTFIDSERTVIPDAPLAEIWLVVERLHETKPPDIDSAALRPWVRLSAAPTGEPRLRDTVDGASLTAAGTHCSLLKPPETGKPAIDPKTTVTLSDYEDAELVRAEYATFLSTKWRPWALEERERRRTIRFYSQLFTLKQQLEGRYCRSTASNFIWGVGLGI